MKKALAGFAALLIVLLMTVSALAVGSMDSIAYMNIDFECGCHRTGAGTMIARNGLITAAHNLVCSDHNRNLKSCSFFFGWDGKTYSYKYSGGFSYTWYADFSGGYSSRDDIAYVIFNEDVGRRTGWYEHGVLDPADDSWSWDYYNMVGYKGKSRIWDTAKINVIDSKQLTWPMSGDFSDCMEGGPVMSSYTVFAVHTSHSGSTGYARLITGDLLNDMLNAGAQFN